MKIKYIFINSLKITTYPIKQKSASVVLELSVWKALKAPSGVARAQVLNYPVRAWGIA